MRPAMPGTNAAQNQIVIVGAGLAGSLLSVYFARRGLDVTVYERRPDPRERATGQDRSINLGLSARGVRALRRVDLWDGLADRLVPMRGRYIHRPDGEAHFQPYGTRPDEILHSIRRDELNGVLIERAEKDGVRFHFGLRCVGLDRDTATVTLVDRSGESFRHAADTVVGADGAFSTVRQHLHRGLPVSFEQEFLDWGYKELTIPARPDGGARTPIEALHVWPGVDGLVVAHPNIDNSLTCTVLLPLVGPASLATLNDADAVTALCREKFPDLLDLIPDLTEQYDAHPVGHLVTIRTSLWHHRDRVVLIGDACHAVTPFYGQGMNAAFEDVLILDECLDRHPTDRAAAFAEYQRLRKPHTDVLADLTADNFVVLRDRLRSPAHLARARMDLLLNRLFPGAWRPLYAMVSHSTMPYGDAVRRAKRQDRVLNVAATAVLIGSGLAGRSALRRAGRRRQAPR